MGLFGLLPNAEDSQRFALGEIDDAPEREQTDSEWVMQVYSEYEDRVGHTMRERDEEEECHRIYTGLRFGQWPESVKNESKKNLSQFNFVAKMVDSLAGYIIRNWWDVDYQSTDSTNVGDLNFVKDLYYIDKNTGDWQDEWTTFIKNGVIKSADLMMYVDYSRNPDFGNVAIRTMTPGTVLWDTNWTSNKSGEARNCFAIRYKTPKELKREFPEKSERLDNLVRLKALESNTEETVDNNGNDVIPRLNLKEEYNNTYKVIDYYYMDNRTTKRKVGLNKSVNLVDVPDDASEEWFIQNEVDPESVIEQEMTEDICYVTTIVPDLDIQDALQDKPALLQLGRLPFFHWSYKRHMGHDIGLIDFVKDPQRYYNEMMSLIHKMIKNARRLTMIDSGAFEDIADIKELEEKFNSGQEVFVTQPDASNEYPNMVRESNGSAPLSQEFSFANQVLGSAEHMTPVNNAMQGLGEGERSAVQFDIKREQGEVNMTLIFSGVKGVVGEVAEAYLQAAKSLYGGMYREFNSPVAAVELNVETDEGRIINDITTIPRCKVIVTESPASISRKTNDRIIAMQILQTVGQQDQVALYNTLKTIFNSMESIPEKDKSEINESLALAKEIAIKNMAYQNGQLDLGILQNGMQLQQMSNPQSMNPQQGDGSEQKQMNQGAAQQPAEAAPQQQMEM